MAKKSGSTATTNGTANKAQAIRDYAAANPTAKPSEISKALKSQGIDVEPGRVSGVLNAKGRGRGVSVDAIKLVSAFVKQFNGKLADAEQAIQKVGKFVEECGGADDALAALASFKELSAALN